MFQLLDSRAERISGPFSGIYVAAYSVLQDTGFCGYAKLAYVKPQDVWTCTAFLKVAAAQAVDSPELALMGAEYQAQLVIAQLST